MNGIIARGRSLWRGMRRPDALAAEMDEEMRFHIEMEAERIARERGVDPAEALRLARVAFGGTDAHKEAGRDARGLTRLSGMSLDFRLGWRMLLRYPWLTAVAVLAMAFGIAFGAGAVQLLTDLYFPPLAYHQPDRIVRLERISTETTHPVALTPEDLAAWRASLTTVDGLSAHASRTRNLSVGGAPGVPVAEASVTASAFSLVRPAMLGRGLVPADEAPGATPVVVLGHPTWKRHFNADPGVVGRVVRLGATQVTVVGVMPPRFGFILPDPGEPDQLSEDLWVPLRLTAGRPPNVEVFGQLKPGVTREQAQAQFSAVGTLPREPGAAETAVLRPRVMAFENPFLAEGSGGTAGILALAMVFLCVLMVTVCANVALLIFARAATREGEMAVRSALGASRGRIVFQLFAEALVLAAVAIVVGLVGASLGLRWTTSLIEEMGRLDGAAPPVSIGGGLSATTVAYAVGLALLGAVVAGVLPGLRVTGRNGQAALQKLPGRGSGVRLGRVWTAVIVGQVALTVMLVPIAGMMGKHAWTLRTADPGVPTSEFLSMRLEMDGMSDLDGERDEAARQAVLNRFLAARRALQDRLAAEPGVRGVTVATALPSAWHGRWTVQVEGAPASADAAPLLAQMAEVDAGFFPLMGPTVLAGRALVAYDFGGEPRAVVVNESFVREHLGGRAAVGRRLRFLPWQEEPGPWMEIVGVVRDMAMRTDPTLPNHAGIYTPLQDAGTYPVHLAVRLADDPRAFEARMRDLAWETDPSLRVEQMRPLDEAGRSMQMAIDGWFRIILGGSALAFLLTFAGIYAINSFTVSRRTREIGVRIALGAQARQIVASILGRMARNVAMGAALGTVLGLALLVVTEMGNGTWRPSGLEMSGLMAGYMTVMTGVCMLACVVPTRRALRIQPRDALNADG